MSRHQKLLERFVRRPKDFTFDELRRLLTSFGYEEHRGGKTSGSRVAFINAETQHIIRLHKPHPGNIVKSYALEQIYDELVLRGVVK